MLCEDVGSVRVGIFLTRIDFFTNLTEPSGVTVLFTTFIFVRVGLNFGLLISTRFLLRISSNSILDGKCLAINVSKNSSLVTVFFFGRESGMHFLTLRPKEAKNLGCIAQLPLTFLTGYSSILIFFITAFRSGVSCCLLDSEMVTFSNPWYWKSGV